MPQHPTVQRTVHRRSPPPRAPPRRRRRRQRRRRRRRQRTLARGRGRGAGDGRQRRAGRRPRGGEGRRGERARLVVGPGVGLTSAIIAGAHQRCRRRSVRGGAAGAPCPPAPPRRRRTPRPPPSRRLTLRSRMPPSRCTGQPPPSSPPPSAAPTRAPERLPAAPAGIGQEAVTTCIRRLYHTCIPPLDQKELARGSGRPGRVWRVRPSAERRSTTAPIPAGPGLKGAGGRRVAVHACMHLQVSLG